MESNSDKQLRDKLSGAEFPFDPAAWDKMEAMLDKKKKRRGFFWWWTGGIAAAVLLGVGVVGYELGSTVGSRQIAIGNNEKEQSAVHSPQSTINNHAKQESFNAISKENTDGDGLLTNEEKSENNNQSTGNASVNRKDTKRNKPSTTGKSQVTKSKKTKAQNTISGSSAMAGDGFIAFNKTRTSQAKGAKRTQTISSKQTAGTTTSSANNSRSIVTQTAIQQEAEMLAAAGAANNLEEPGNLPRMEASLLAYVSENAITGIDKKEEDVLPKTQKRIFNYSLGVLANITGSTLGKQPDNPNVPARPTLFYDRPSYMVGFTHDFLFVNSVAITNSILYSRTSFDVLQPKSENYPVTLTYYTSRITELTIPIGIKVYPVVKQNFKFYINAGIINHIKFKETFDYSVRIDTNFTANLGNATDQFFPIENSFDPNTKSHDVLAGVNGAPATTTDDFSINKSKRYYASFYAGAGVEYIAKKHFILFAEPVFYMGLQKIGVQDKRKYNLGLSGGFRYQF